MDYKEECQRKGKLLDLFLALEQSELKRFKNSIGKYEKKFRGVARVESFEEDRMRLVRDSGQPLSPFAINAEIAALLKRGDELAISAGYSQGKWRLISMEMIGSYIGGQAHISMMNPALRNPAYN